MDGILSVGDVARHAQGEGENAAFIKHNELLQSLPVAALGPPQQIRFGNFVGRRLHGGDRHGKSQRSVTSLYVGRSQTVETGLRLNRLLGDGGPLIHITTGIGAIRPKRAELQ